MLYSHRIKRKSQLDPLKTVGGAILVIAVLVLLIVIGVIPIGKKTTEISGLGPSMDATCLASSRFTLGPEASGIDTDNDKRDDYACDSCVCEKGCNNNLREKGGDDSDGDTLPDICDAAPNDRSNFKFSKENCPLEKLLNVSRTRMQCRPTAVQAPAAQPQQAPANPPVPQPWELT
jgi:hypothetical protein